MRVLLGIAGMAMGGAERVVLELVRALLDRGDPVAVAGDAGPLDPVLGDLGVRRYPIPGYGRSPVQTVRAAWALRAVIRSFRPDLIHSQNVKATGVAALARFDLRRQVPLLATFHGVEQREYRTAALILRATDRVVCVSEDLVEGLTKRGFPSDRIGMIHNAVPLPVPLTNERRRGLDSELGLEGRPVISIVGRLFPQKAHHRFLDAAAEVARRVPSCRFLIIGDGPLRGELEAQAHQGLSESVTFTGIRDDARDLIACSDVTVFSSDWEGMPIAALEALAAGVPVVATDVEGMRELLGTGAGVLVAREATALAEAIVELLEDPGRRAEMGRIGRKVIAGEFSLERMVSSYLEVYRELDKSVRGDARS